MSAQLGFTFKVGRKRQRLVWQVIAVLDTGRSIGNCGHEHAEEMDAVRCTWAPPDWDDYPVCDLLVRQVRDRRIDPPRNRRGRL